MVIDHALAMTAYMTENIRKREGFQLVVEVSECPFLVVYGRSCKFLIFFFFLRCGEVCLAPMLSMKCVCS